jgi:hypothetical protein
VSQLTSLPNGAHGDAALVAEGTPHVEKLVKGNGAASMHKVRADRAALILFS